MKTFKLTAWVHTTNSAAIEQALRGLSILQRVIPTDVGFFLEANIRGKSAASLNKHLLDSLRDVDRSASIHAEWKSSVSTDWFFNDVRKRSRHSAPSR